MQQIIGYICLAALAIGTLLVLTYPPIWRSTSYGNGGGGPGSHTWVILRDGSRLYGRVVGYGKDNSYAVAPDDERIIFTRYEQGAWLEVTDELDKLDHWLGVPWPKYPHLHT